VTMASPKMRGLSRLRPDHALSEEKFTKVYISDVSIELKIDNRLTLFSRDE
jgi:hypothetical protein